MEVVYKTLPGWKTSTEDCRRFEDLPAAARAYVKAIEDILHVPVRWVGVGASRDAMITRWGYPAGRGLVALTDGVDNVDGLLTVTEY